jgi:hypothetical protein
MEIGKFKVKFVASTGSHYKYPSLINKFFIKYEVWSNKTLPRAQPVWFIPPAVFVISKSNL